MFFLTILKAAQPNEKPRNAQRDHCISEAKMQLSKLDNYTDPKCTHLKIFKYTRYISVYQ